MNTEDRIVYTETVVFGIAQMSISEVSNPKLLVKYWPMFAIFSTTFSWIFGIAGIAIGIGLSTVVMADIIEYLIGNLIAMQRVYLRLILAFLQFFICYVFWIVVGVPQWVLTFLPWLGVVLTQLLVGTPIVERLVAKEIVRRLVGHIVLWVVILVMTFIVRLVLRFGGVR